MIIILIESQLYLSRFLKNSFKLSQPIDSELVKEINQLSSYSSKSSTPCSSNRLLLIYFKVASWVALKNKGAAAPSWRASFHLRAQTHHLSPGFNPGKSYSGTGVIKSFPRLRLNFKNSSVTLTHTLWHPRSSEHVCQKPSRKYPVKGFSEHSSNSEP